MKKIIISFLALWGTVQADAQYFHHRYADYGSSGNGIPYGTEHLMACRRQTPAMPYAGLTVVRTNIDGGFTSASNFNNTYLLRDPAAISMTNPSGVVHINSVKISGIGTSTEYAAVGGYSFLDVAANTTKYGVFYVKLSSSGTPVTVAGYLTPSNYSANVSSVFQDPYAADKVYATGSIMVSGSEDAYIFAMKIDISGTLTWGKIYDIPSARVEWSVDIIRDLSTSSGNVFVVGNFETDYPCGNQYGFWLALDNVTGNVQYSRKYSVSGGRVEIQAINYAQNNGFALGGLAFDCSSAPTQSWVMHVSSTGQAGFFSKKYSSPHTGNASAVRDIVSRATTSGSWEYFTTGDDIVPPVVNSNIIAMRLDNTGSLISGKEYRPGAIDRGVSIGIMNPATAPGIGIYGYNDNSMYIIKSYYNGVSGCSEIPYGPGVNDLSVSISNETVGYVNTFTPRNLYHHTTASNSDQQVCYNQTITGGQAPAMNTPGTEPGQNINVYPNPAGSNFTIRLDHSGATRVEIYSAVGQLVFEQNTDPVNEQLVVNSKNWNNGLYLVKVYSNNTLLGTSKLIIKQ